jgi:hypothetical protein
MRKQTGTLEWWVSRIHPDDALSLEKGLHGWLMGAASN